MTQASKPRASVGIVIPTYKESESIASLVTELFRFVPEALVAIVDDSPDLATVRAAESLGDARVVVVHREGKGGRGSAVLAGVRLLLERGCARIIEMDADFSHPPSQIPDLLLESIQRNLDLLIASRYLADSRIENWPVSRRLFSRASNLLARSVLSVPVRDYTNGFRVYSRPAAELIAAKCGRLGKGFISLSEILVNLHFRGYRVGELPTVFTNRLRGESSLGFREIRDAAAGLVRIWLLKRELASGGSRAETQDH